MTTTGSNGKVTEVQIASGPAVDAVRAAALDLLAALPRPPQRLRVQAADVTVELDWPVPAAPPGQAAGPVPAATPTPAAEVPAPTAEAPAATQVLVANGAGAGAGEPAAAAGADADDPATQYVCAPSVGTFYHAPEPGAAPFVAEGTPVAPGQQVGIVEAMKLMIPVVSDRAGRVRRILVPNGQPVEYGQRLVALGPEQGA